MQLLYVYDERRNSLSCSSSYTQKSSFAMNGIIAFVSTDKQNKPCSINLWNLTLIGPKMLDKASLNDFFKSFVYHFCLNVYSNKILSSATHFGY